MSDTLLLVDDDPLLRRGLSYSLEHQGFQVETAGDADQALAQARARRPDLVLLDIGLPGMDGLDAMRIFQHDLRLPVILLTARRSSQDEALGLELGADDYMAKPFDTDRLVARIRAVLRRATCAEASAALAPVTAGPLTIIPKARTVRIAGRALDLPPRTFDLLYALAADFGQVRSIESLLRQVWGPDFDGQSQVVYVAINELRRTLARAPGHGLRIITEHRVGYKLIEEEA